MPPKETKEAKPKAEKKGQSIPNANEPLLMYRLPFGYVSL